MKCVIGIQAQGTSEEDDAPDSDGLKIMIRLEAFAPLPLESVPIGYMYEDNELRNGGLLTVPLDAGCREEMPLIWMDVCGGLKMGSKLFL